MNRSSAGNFQLMNFIDTHWYIACASHRSYALLEPSLIHTVSCLSSLSAFLICHISCPFLPLAPYRFPHQRWWKVMFLPTSIYIFENNFLVPVQVWLLPYLVSHTLGHRGRGDYILEGQRSRSVGEVCALLNALLVSSCYDTAQMWYIMIITCLIVVDYDCSNMISDGRTLSTRSSSNFSSFELYLTLMLFFF